MMGPHAERKESLTCLHLRKMITDSYPLETPSHIFDQTRLLECIPADRDIDREIRIMDVLYQMDGCVEGRIPLRVFLTP